MVGVDVTETLKVFNMVSEEKNSVIEENKIPPSAKRVLSLIGNRPLTAKSILKESKLAPRTVRYALKKLLEANMIQKVPNLEDMRKYLYIKFNK
jgi:DNA-binding MarR family transcriptional regulator